MTTREIVADFERSVKAKIELVEQGTGRFAVVSPFTFEDGDGLVIVLKRESGRWVLTDEGHTFMHLSYYDIDASKGKRGEVIDRKLNEFGISNDDGELRLPIEGDDYGNALFSFVQGLIHVSDASYMSREQVKSLFYEDLEELVTEVVLPEHLTKDYHDPSIDPDMKYKVDYRINGRRTQLFLFGILNDGKCRDSTIACLIFDNHDIPFVASAVFEKQESINRTVLARFSDVCEKQFPSLSSAKERLKGYIERGGKR